MSPALRTVPALTMGNVLVRDGLVVEPCASYDEAVTLAEWLVQGGIDAGLATPKAHGCWGVYLRAGRGTP